MGEKSHALAVHGAEVGVLKKAYHVVFCTSLQGAQRVGCPSIFLLKLFPADLSDQVLEGSDWNDILGLGLQELNVHEDSCARQSLPILHVLAQLEGIDALTCTFATAGIAGTLVGNTALPVRFAVAGGLAWRRLLESRLSLHDNLNYELAVTMGRIVIRGTPIPASA